ncbi:hypothetical protein F5B17DRAFT_448726 [Nemania serpens]|nr:hypothetical protein F5B17DRAFT_448726 [Nemania serpens]
MSRRVLQEDNRSDSSAKGQVDRPSDDSHGFSWNTNFQCSEQERIFIKEQALKDGIKQCEKLIDKIKQSFHNIEVIDDRFASGKTSALNALLGYEELLPTSNEEASTAVPCKIEYNHDDDPAHAFRCHVTLRKKNDLKKQLDQFFEDIRQRNELKYSDYRSIEDEKAFRNYNSLLEPVFEMIETVFGIEKEQAERMDARRILNSRREVIALLETTKKFHHSTLQGISEKIKPYIDSTEADHGNSGLDFTAWPLIDQVELFVKSDILRDGVVLVDLPGAADAVGSRTAVAERYFSHLATTLVMVEAKQAASDSTNVGLMSKQQEMATMLNGNFHKRSFCVCVSQIDSIDRTAALRKKEARDNKDL